MQVGQYTLAEATKQYVRTMSASRRIHALLDDMRFKDLNALLRKTTTRYIQEGTPQLTTCAEEPENIETEHTNYYVDLFFERVLEKAQTDVVEMQTNAIIDIEKGATYEIINNLQVDKRRLIATILLHRYLRDNTRFYDADSYVVGELEYELQELRPVYENIVSGTFTAS